MLAPSLALTTDPRHGIATVTVTGPVTTADHADALDVACSLAPAHLTLVVNLTAVAAITETGLDGLRALARASSDRGQRLVFVCADLMLRSELVLADLDTLAPVVHATEQAEALAA